MVRALFIFATAVSLAILPRIAVAADQPLSPPIACANGLIGGMNCVPTKNDLKNSREAFERGLKLHKRDRLEEAFEQFDKAARLNPQSIDYLRAREGLRAKLVFDHIQSGNVLMLQDARLRAAAEFRAAIDLDGNNQFAQQRLEEATRVSIPALNKVLPAPLAESTEIHLDPIESRATFHFTGDSRSLFTQLASAYSV
jgi:tetratricopeptide (TPR) repeat protein